MDRRKEMWFKEKNCTCGPLSRSLSEIGEEVGAGEIVGTDNLLRNCEAIGKKFSELRPFFPCRVEGSLEPSEVSQEEGTDRFLSAHSSPGTDCLEPTLLDVEKGKQNLKNEIDWSAHHIYLQRRKRVLKSRPVLLLDLPLPQ